MAVPDITALIAALKELFEKVTDADLTWTAEDGAQRFSEILRDYLDTLEDSHVDAGAKTEGLRSLDVGTVESQLQDLLELLVELEARVTLLEAAP